ncbi:hypothetical protein [Sphingobium lactosutens]|uniref:Uncharacterized protein n=1 Tax=Sphingobium lactosutens DS20 TaxID=1331060 RepID=T0H743_9SPHN|nr:hypothetical protein [Sphingobium lactosutens]EQB12156.1 hypothetical protein RLDS_20605 [Sphingobium lactosutens DS20]
MAHAQQQRLFTEAFASWFAAAGLHDIMAVEPCVGRDAVEINFLIGGGAIRGYAHPVGISVSAVLGDECWDFLFDEDVVPVNDRAKWFCSFCEPNDRRLFLSIEALWIDHLFDPLRRWIDEQLRPATTLEFHRVEGATWARLTTEPTEASATATSVIALDAMPTEASPIGGAGP